MKLAREASHTTTCFVRFMALLAGASGLRWKVAKLSQSRNVVPRHPDLCDLPLIDPNPAAKFPEVFLYLQLPTMLLVLLMLRIFITRSVKRGHFMRWYGYPLIAINVVFVILQVVLTR